MEKPKRAGFLEAGLEDDIAQDLSSEASEPELQRLKETGEGK